jgi:hypothetical protein
MRHRFVVVLCLLFLPLPAFAANSRSPLPLRPGTRAILSAIWQTLLAAVPGGGARSAAPELVLALFAAAEAPSVASPAPGGRPASSGPFADSGVELDPHGNQ